MSVFCESGDLDDLKTPLSHTALVKRFLDDAYRTVLEAAIRRKRRKLYEKSHLRSFAGGFKWRIGDLNP